MEGSQRTKTSTLPTSTKPVATPSAISSVRGSKHSLGEEYCDITQVVGPYGFSPTQARRALLYSQISYIMSSNNVSLCLSSDSGSFVFKVVGPYGFSPTQARRALFIIYQRAAPYFRKNKT